jgi:hypothetical protein
MAKTVKDLARRSGHQTASLWGATPSRYYRFLRLVEHEIASRPVRFAVLGCADGKFVLPAARRGFSVVAIDVDEVALFGGCKVEFDGTKVEMPGLLSRLQGERLEAQVQILSGDFVTLRCAKHFHAVFTSGAVQYSRNLVYSFDEIVKAVQSYVAPGGLLYVDYMLPWEEKYRGRPICPEKQAWTVAFPPLSWSVLHNRVVAPTSDGPHVEMPFVHHHQWGHLLAKKRLRSLEDA